MTIPLTTKPPRVAVIIMHAGNILLLYRYKQGRTYYVVTGGTVEPDESLTQAAIREIKEETDLDIALDKKLWDFDNKGRIEHYYLSTRFSGELRLGGPEIERQSEENIYRLEWISLSKLRDIPLVPAPVKMRILKELPNILKDG